MKVDIWSVIENLAVELEETLATVQLQTDQKKALCVAVLFVNCALLFVIVQVQSTKGEKIGI